jgi:hypothetical protein
MRLGSRRLGEVRLGWPGKTAGAALPTVYGDGQPYYRIEVRDASGDLLATVPRWIASDTEERINEPITLSLSIWYGDFAAQYLVNPNQVWLYRGDGATPEHKCIIYRTRDESTEGEIRTVQAHGLLRKLADETVTEYDTGEDGKQVRAIVADLLGFQTLAPTIRAGFIASAYGNETRVLRVEYKTVWQALDELRTTLGGVFTLTPENRLDWRVSSGVNIGHVIRIGRNATSVTREMDYESVFTRVVGLGAGVSDDTRLKVTVNDAAAQTLYGVRVGYLNDQSITDEDALTAAATAALNRWKVPRTKYSVGVIDLSRADLYSINFEAFGVTLGTRVNLIAAGIGLDIDTRIASVRRDLADPLGVSVTVTDPDAGEGVQGPDDGGNDPERAEPDDLESWAESVERRLQRTEGDTGVLGSVASAIGVGSSESSLGNVAWWDPSEPDGNLPELLEDVLGSDDPDAVSLQEALSDFVAGSSGAAQVTHYKVDEIEDDYLVCRAWNEESDTAVSETPLIVAKPRMLRRTPFDGESVAYQDGQTVGYVYSNGYTRTATDTGSSESEVQVVTPGWFEGDIIRATKKRVVVWIDDAFEYADYEDVNTGARTWAAVDVE